MIRLCAILGLLGFSIAVLGQMDSLVLLYSTTITEDDLREHLSVLASDEYEGRETGFAGQKKAAAYIVGQFQSMGIPPISGKSDMLLDNGYEQSFELALKKPGGLEVQIGDQSFSYMEDILFFNKELNDSRSFSDLVFAGYGLDNPQHNDMAQLSCDGCIMLMLGGVPKSKRGEPKVSLDGATSEMQMMSLKSKNAAGSGASVLLLVSDAIGKMRGQFGNFLRSSRMSLMKEEESEQETPSLQTILISEEMADIILKEDGSSVSKEAKKLLKKGPRSRKVAIPTAVKVTNADSSLRSENVLGYIEGSDKKDELVVITAHYDHVGVMDGQVFNGADDDGSGTVALLELAQAFAQAKSNGHGPRRSMLFMTVSGEEKGLLGSEYYSDNPIFPLENTIVDLNIDMIGRHDKEHDGKAPYVYVIGSDRLSTDLHRINEEANEDYVGLELDYTYNEPDDPNRFYYRSDHYNFARKGIPVAFYFSGVHDDYHQPGDDVERIEFDLLEKRTKLIFHTAWELANREERIVVDGEVE